MTLLDRLLGRQPAHKAVYGGAWLNALQGGPMLSTWIGNDWNERAKVYLQTYKVGWFYKAESRISRDFANLMWTLAYEDEDGDNTTEIVAAPNSVPFEKLDPLEQFLRLSEYPNPYQTGRSFKQQQMIRLDMTGRALTFLVGGKGGALPTEFYSINPARMWESRDSDGRRIGWVLDKDRTDGGVPFEVEEILLTEYPGAENDPQGVVEAVYAQVPVSKQLPKHISDVMSTGGRLAGMAWPKNRTLNEDEFLDAQRAWRSVTSDPDAARKLLLFPEPMEYATGASSPQELGIPELALLSRDEILTAFPISPHMLQVPLAAGLNSGESLNVVRREYWEGTMHPRVEVWEDAFQQQLIPRYESATGRALDFDIEEPSLDDAPTLIEKVGAMRGLIAVGFDPDAAIQAAGLDHIKWTSLPDLLNPAAQAAAAATTPDPNAGMAITVGDTNRQDAAATTQTVTAKAILRADVIGEAWPGLHATVSRFLDDQRERVSRKITATMPAAKAERMKANEDWWDAAAEDAALEDAMRESYVKVGRDALLVVADTTSRVIAGKTVDRVLAQMLERSGLRITEINETTRKSIAETLDIGVRRGYSIPQLVNGVPGEAFGGVQGALTANGVNVWDSYRAEMIARTETMTAYNESALLGYKDVNVRQVQAIDGDKDTECADRDGKVFSVDDALSIADHPNGTLDWVPLTA